MVVGREVAPDGGAVRVQHEAAVVDAVRVFVGENPQVGRRRVNHVREDVVLAPALPVDARDGRTHCGIVKPALDEAVHRHAAHARHFPAADLAGVFVGRTFVDAGRLRVRAELGVAVAHLPARADEVEQVGVVAVVRHEGEEAVDPAARILHVLGVGRQAILEVADVKRPRDEELALVVEAVNAGGIVLGLGQRGQQHPGENRDDGDHHEQLNQREALGQARSGWVVILPRQNRSNNPRFESPFACRRGWEQPSRDNATPEPDAGQARPASRR